MSDTTIRLATVDDAPQLLSLIRSLVTLYGEPLPSETDMEAIIRRQIESDYHEYIVAETRERIFGCLLICYYLSTWAGAPYALFQDFIVEPEQRNQGVGSTLLAYARNRARIKECVRVDLIVHPELDKAKRFFGRWGFERIKRDLMRMQLSQGNK